MTFLIIFCYVLGIGMFYLAIAQGVSYAYVYGSILLVCATYWVLKRMVENRKKELEEQNAKK